MAAEETGAAGLGSVQGVVEEVAEVMGAVVEIVAEDAFDAGSVAGAVETDAAAVAAAVGTCWDRGSKVDEGLGDWDSGLVEVVRVTSQPPPAPVPCPHLE